MMPHSCWRLRTVQMLPPGEARPWMRVMGSLLKREGKALKRASSLERQRRRKQEMMINIHVPGVRRRLPKDKLS